MGLLVLDTTVWIDFLRGRPVVDRVRSHLRAGDELCISPISMEELYRGVRETERGAVDSLVDGLRFAPLTKAAAQNAGEWRRAHARRGRTLSQADCLIAASAWALGATLGTGNPKDFPMRELRVEHWPVGR